MRSLRHYDAIGLISPSLRLKTGYRLYSPMDLARAQQVIALKSFGIELQDIKEALSDHFDLQSLFNKQITFLKEKIQSLQEASRILEQVTTELERTQSLSTDKMMKLIGLYTMSTIHFERYLQEKKQMNASQIESILKEEKRIPASELTSQEIKEAQKINLNLGEKHFEAMTIDQFMKKHQESGLNDAELMGILQKELADRKEIVEKSGYTKERMDLLKKSGKHFNQKMALAMIHGYLASSSEVQNIIAEYFSLIALDFSQQPESLKAHYREYYKALPANEGVRAYLDDLSPGLVYFMSEAILHFIENQIKK